MLQLDLQDFLIRNNFGMAYTGLHLVQHKDWVQEKPDLKAKRISMCATAPKV